MKQSRMSKIYDSKIFWMILSLLASIVLWAYISNQDSTPINRALMGVKVEFVGEDLLREQHGLAISDVNSSSVDVWIRGTRQAVGSLDASQVVAEIDVSKITQAGDMSWSYSLKYPTGTDKSAISVVSRSPETISFTVSTLEKKTIDVRGTFEGSLAEGYSAEDPVFEPSTITVVGSSAALSKISYANVTFSKENVSETFSTDVGYTLMDASGNACSTAGLTFSTDVIKATLPIKGIKDVPLSVNLIAGGGATAENCTVTIEPASIKLAGDSKLLDSTNKIIVGTVDIADFTSEYEETLPITIDDALENVTGLTSAKVKISVVGLVTKTFNVTDITCINLGEGYTADIATENISVVMRGTEEAISSLTADKLRAVADMTEYSDTTGTVMAGVKIYADGSSAGALGNYKITVTLTKG